MMVSISNSDIRELLCCDAVTDSSLLPRSRAYNILLITTLAWFSENSQVCELDLVINVGSVSFENCYCAAKKMKMISYVVINQLSKHLRHMTKF